MTTIEAIVNLREIVNRGNSSDNIEIDTPRAINLLNIAQLKFLKKTIENKSNEDVRRIQTFLISQKVLKLSKRENAVSFRLPKNYFELANVFPKGKKGKCVDALLATEVKAENIHQLLFDENNQPSFYWRETFYTVKNNTISVYTDDFDIVDVDLLYYRQPKKIDLKGYTNIEGNQSTDSNPEWDDYSLIKIIEIAAKDFNINVENLQRFQIDTQRIITK